MDSAELKSSLRPDALAAYVSRQVNAFFPDPFPVGGVVLVECLQRAMDRYALCCSNIHLKYYNDNGPVFNHLNSDQYAMFLYFLSHELGRRGVEDSATKIYYLNKVLHSLDVFYQVELPDIFLFGHPVGTVLGRARYDNYLVVYQNCTVGNNGGVYPQFGEGVALYKGASVIGNCTIGPNTQVAAHTLVRDQNVAGECVVFGNSPDLTVKSAKNSVRKVFFGG
jgi:serine O-acetyltransferase